MAAARRLRTAMRQARSMGRLATSRGSAAGDQAAAGPLAGAQRYRHMPGKALQDSNAPSHPIQTPQPLLCYRPGLGACLAAPPSGKRTWLAGVPQHAPLQRRPVPLLHQQQVQQHLRGGEGGGEWVGGWVGWGLRYCGGRAGRAASALAVRDTSPLQDHAQLLNARGRPNPTAAMRH